MSAPYRNFDELHSDAVTLSGLCELAECICCERPEWDLAALLVAMSQIAERLSSGSEWVNLPKGGEA
ncbi:hypothetical protein [Paenirhodobacter sp.]|uniref:hypothetical protein n=1 Tax=Paenirhodobacter sp. TaxID=1965326 RepID=UPI003B510F12